MSEFALPGFWLPPRPGVVIPKIRLPRWTRPWTKTEDLIAQAVALDQSLGQGNQAASNTCTLTTGAAVASGAIIVVAFAAFRSGTFTTATLSGGGLTWATDQFLASGNIRIGFASAKAPAGLASSTVLTVTGSPSQSSDWIMGAGSFTGIDTSGTILTGTGSSSGTGTTHTSGNITANAGDLIVECSFEDGSGTATGSATAPALLLFNKTVAGQTEALVCTYKLAMTATDAIGGAWSTSVTHVDAGASYKAAAGVAAKTPPFQGRTARNMLLRR